MGIAKRNSSVELLRLLSIFLIVLMHLCSLIEYEQCILLNKLWIGLLNAVGNCGVTCFILISGYYGVSINKSKFIYLIIISTLYTILVSFFNYGLDINELIKAICVIPLYGKNLWFIICYLFLMLLSPYVNQFCDLLNREDYKRLLIILTIFLSVIPTLFIAPTYNGILLSAGGKCFMYFIYVYLLGRFVKLHLNEIHINRRLWAMGGALLIFIMIILNFAISTWMGKRYFIYSYDCSPFILVLSLLFFYIFKQSFYINKWINSLSSSVLAIFVLNYSFPFFDKLLFNISSHSTDLFLVLYVFIEALVVFLCSYIIDNTLGRTVRIFFK